MDSDTPEPGPLTSGDAADHIVEARDRARQVLAAEAHGVEVDDWRTALGVSREALMIVWLTYVALHGFGLPAGSDRILVVVAIGLALLFALSTARATQVRVEYFQSELERERDEIRNSLDHEREELRVLYAAKGFQGSVLDQIVDTLSADENRLLKVMMEEELGLSMHHISHPLLVGISNFLGALVGGLTLALPTMWLRQEQTAAWMIGGGGVLLVVFALISASFGRRSAIGMCAASIMTAAICGGVVHYLAAWLAKGFVHAS